MTADTELLKHYDVTKPSVDAGPTPRKVLRRKTGTDIASVIADATADKDPAAQASLIAAAWRGGVGAVIDTGILMMESLQAFGDDPDRLDAFIAGLVDGHLLTPNEARLRLVSPKLIKLRAIGEHAKLLRRKEIAPYLAPSYSSIYQLIVLFRMLPDRDGEQRVKRLVSILQRCPGEITREYLSDETDRLKRSQKSDKAKVTGEQTSANASAGETLRELTKTQERVDLVLLTPREGDLRVLGTAYADGDTMKRCLPLGEVLQHSDSVAALIVARVCDLPVIVDRLLPLCGFARPSRVLLARQPKSLDVTDAEVFITAERGDMRLCLPKNGRSLDDAGQVDPLAVAVRLYPDAKRKMHVFATAPTPGWTSLVGDDSWAEEPSLR